jgi:hypothetical protein
MVDNITKVGTKIIAVSLLMVDWVGTYMPEGGGGRDANVVYSLGADHEYQVLGSLSCKSWGSSTLICANTI